MAVMTASGTDLRRRRFRSIAGWGFSSWRWWWVCVSCLEAARSWRMDLTCHWGPWLPGSQLGWSLPSESVCRSRKTRWSWFCRAGPWSYLTIARPRRPSLYPLGDREMMYWSAGHRGPCCPSDGSDMPVRRASGGTETTSVPTARDGLSRPISNNRTVTAIKQCGPAGCHSRSLSRHCYTDICRLIYL